MIWNFSMEFWNHRQNIFLYLLQSHLNYWFRIGSLFIVIFYLPRRNWNLLKLQEEDLLESFLHKEGYKGISLIKIQRFQFPKEIEEVEIHNRLFNLFHLSFLYLLLLLLFYLSHLRLFGEHFEVFLKIEGNHWATNYWDSLVVSSLISTFLRSLKAQALICFHHRLEFLSNFFYIEQLAQLYFYILLNHQRLTSFLSLKLFYCLTKVHLSSMLRKSLFCKYLISILYKQNF